MGAKRLVVLLPADVRRQADSAWLEGVAEYATIVGRGAGDPAAVKPGMRASTIA